MYTMFIQVEQNHKHISSLRYKKTAFIYLQALRLELHPLVSHFLPTIAILPLIENANHETRTNATEIPDPVVDHALLYSSWVFVQRKPNDEPGHERIYARKMAAKAARAATPIELPTVEAAPVKGVIGEPVGWGGETLQVC